MLTAITRAVSPAIHRCELEYVARLEIDLVEARAQHRLYEACLGELGLRVISLAPEPGLPDSMFVEDPVVVVNEVAVMTRMGAPSRRGESQSLARALAPFRPLRWLREPATLEGGDVMRVERRLFVGVSARTNAEGIAQLAAELEPFGYTVEPVEVRGCLHLKSGCSYVGDRTILANRALVDASRFAGFDVVDVAPDEPGAANVLTIGDTVLMPSAFPSTAQILARRRWKVRALDISELMKAEAAMTCSSVIFEGQPSSHGQMPTDRM